MDKSTICLLLTATISPFDNVPNLQRKNKEDRQQDYFDAVKFWVKFELPIIFCDNSLTTYEPIVELLNNSNQPCEYLTFNGQKSINGKGHGEAEIFQYVFRESRIIRKYNYIIKCTGRYTVPNILKIIQVLDYKDLNVIANISKNLSWVDSRMFVFNPVFYDYYLSDKLNQINEAKNIYFENILANALLFGISEGVKWQMFQEYPLYQGVYGTANIKYTNTLFSRIKYKTYQKIKNWIFNYSI